MIKKKYDDKGNVIEAGNYGFFGFLKENEDGIALEKYKLDKNGNIIEERYFGKYSELKNDKSRGFAIMKLEYDDQGNRVKQKTFDEDEKLTEDNNGFAIVETKYDKSRNIIEMRHYGRNSKLKPDSTGVAIAKFKYDKNNNPIEVKLYDSHEKLINKEITRDGRVIDNDQKILRKNKSNIKKGRNTDYYSDTQYLTTDDFKSVINALVGKHLKFFKSFDQYDGDEDLLIRDLVFLVADCVRRALLKHKDAKNIETILLNILSIFGNEQEVYYKNINYYIAFLIREKDGGLPLFDGAILFDTLFKHKLFLYYIDYERLTFRPEAEMRFDSFPSPDLALLCFEYISILRTEVEMFVNSNNWLKKRVGK